MKADLTLPQGYEIHEIPPDYSGKVWIEGQLRQYANHLEEQLEAFEVVDQMSVVADKYAHRLAMYLELVLSSPKQDKWWDEAMQCIGDYRSEMNAIHEEHAPTHFGEPVIL